MYARSMIKYSYRNSRTHDKFSRIQCIHGMWHHTIVRLNPYCQRNIFFILCKKVIEWRLISQIVHLLDWAYIYNLYRNSDISNNRGTQSCLELRLKCYDIIQLRLKTCLFSWHIWAQVQGAINSTEQTSKWCLAGLLHHRYIGRTRNVVTRFW